MSATYQTLFLFYSLMLVSVLIEATPVALSDKEADKLASEILEIMALDEMSIDSENIELVLKRQEIELMNETMIGKRQLEGMNISQVVERQTEMGLNESVLATRQWELMNGTEMIKRQLELLNGTDLAKRQDELVNDSVIVKRQTEMVQNLTSAESLKRGDVLSAEVLDIATRQLEEALANQTIDAEKRQEIEYQVAENRQFINETIEAIKRQMYENGTVQVMVMKRQLINESSVTKRQKLENETLSYVPRKNIISDWLEMTERQMNESGIILKVRTLAARSLAQVLELPDNLDMGIDNAKLDKFVDDSAGKIQEGSQKGLKLMRKFWTNIKEKLMGVDEDSEELKDEMSESDDDDI